MYIHKMRVDESDFEGILFEISRLWGNEVPFVPIWEYGTVQHVALTLGISVEWCPKYTWS
jgi:hypothetical protein